MSLSIKRVAWASLSVFAALLVIRDPPPTWVIWLVLFFVGLSNYTASLRKAHNDHNQNQ